MMRINLLPAELREKRKYERFYPYVFIVGGVLLAVVVLAWLALQLTASGLSDELQQTQESVNTLEAQAQAFAIFEAQESELQARQQVAAQALTGRVDMGTLLEEVSLVLPDPVWVEELTLNQTDGLVLNAWCPDDTDATLKDGYKVIAATLVRLNALEDLYDVWLTEAASDAYEDFQGKYEGESLKSINFESTGKISIPGTSTADAAAAPPPPPAGQ